MPEQPAILPLAAEVSLAVGGGKGANLARLLRAGFPVPGGFLITTHAYHSYLAANRLEEEILDIARRAPAEDPAALEEASRTIRARFAAGALPAALAAGVRDAYAALGRPPVAVRSSATTEDLPELSFAGQQETFLNVTGDDVLLEAVVRCWSSLWTARAIGYRAGNGIEHRGAALGVVVQEMVASEAAGVLFTANPLTGKRTETVIDATLGLGEALVSGQVEPDHYVVDPLRSRILGKQLGAKAMAIRPRPGGGTVSVTEEATDRQALLDSAIIELSSLGQRIAGLFGSPQDVEWAWASGRLVVLQSRPITSLFPVPERMAPEPLQVLASFGAIQGVLDPLTPLGRDTLRQVVANIANSIGLRTTAETERFLPVAAERLFVNITGIVRHRLARRLIRRGLPVIEPGIAGALEPLLSEPALAPKKGRINLRIVARLAPLFVRLLGGIGFNLLWPDAGRLRIQRRIEALIESFRAKGAAATTLAERLALLGAPFTAAILSLRAVIVPGLATGFSALRFILYLAADLPGGEQAVLELTRGLPHNVTTEMDLALWRTAAAVNADPVAAARFRQPDAATLANETLAGQLPAVAQEALDGFLRRYGMRGIAEIDLGRPRWREDPTPLLRVLQSYLQIADPERAPDAVFARGAASAGAKIAALADAVRRTRFGWLKSRFVRWAGLRVRALAGLRESPKFTVIRLLGVLREGLLASGRELAAAGVLARPDDLFFLHLEEARALATGERRDWRALAASNRAAYERETRRRQVPRVLLSDGRAFFDGVAEPVGEADADLVGTPVSAGVVEGVVHVVHDPHGVRLAPGEILVCRGTDPAWTPLFLAAGGLVTEVGGLMTHGSVVAREYGIPAVVGVPQATTRLKSGQRVRLDGSRGRVTVTE
jgi:pyruvate,water dikinase